MTAKLDAFGAALAGITELNLNGLAVPVRLHILEQMETTLRRHIAVSHDMIGDLAKEDPADLGGPPHQVIADWLRISYTEARRRIRDAQQLSPRLTLTGQQLPPELPATAVAWRDGVLDAQHLRVIQTFVHDLPQDTPVAVVEHAEKQLAEQAAQLRPDQLQKTADRAAVLINPDGKFSDNDRARQRGFTWSGQRHDGMSVGTLVASPELRANIDAWLARFAAPGMCNPDDETPCVTGQPDDDAASKDLRTPAQRQHDALNALVRGQLGDPKLGQHNGLPVTVIVSTTLQELTSASGPGGHGRGHRAAHARRDPHGPPRLPLPRHLRQAHQPARCIWAAPAASPRQINGWSCMPKTAAAQHRAAMCPGTGCEVHHIDDWATGGKTDADKLTFACAGNHKLVGKGWTTRKLPNGRTEWIPPPHLDHGQKRTNDYHHPERMFDGDEPG